jgi:hypothetical protein
MKGSSAVLERRAPDDRPPSVLAALRVDLAWLAGRLRLVVERDRHRREHGAPEEYRGLYVSDDEVDALTAELSRGEPLGADPARAPAAGGPLDPGTPLARLTDAFGLNRDERLALVAALAPHVDRAFDRVFAYINDDITRRRPTVGIVLEVLAETAAEALELRALLRPDAPLVRHRLVNLAEDGSFGATPLISRYVELDPHVAEFLLGHHGIDARLQPFASLLPREEEGDSTSEIARALSGPAGGRVYVGGRWSGEKRAAIRRACADLGLAVLELRVPQIADATAAREAMPLALRDARLLGAGIVVTGWDAPSGDEPVLKEIAAAIKVREEFPHPIFLCGRADVPDVPLDRIEFHLVVPGPTYDERIRLWMREGASDQAGRIAASFRLGSMEIEAAGRMAGRLARLQGLDQPGLAELQAGARLQTRPRLSTLAHKLTPRFGWDDIVLSDDRLQQLREIVAQASFQNTVYEEWGLGEKLTLGRGIVALFAGPSGTGKTMAAEVIAGELGQDMYKIDLSGLVSKYIGETEKNLGRVFDEAADSDAVLFFDEADAVFGKRSEVRDSHDRYANIEVGYLLQRLEEHDGIVILATNLRANIDEAFLRRMRSVIEFPFPEEEDRRRIWERTLGRAPRSQDVDVEFLAREYRVSGGNIRNIALLAAFLAASEGKVIGTRHLVQAAKREYQKLGRLVNASEPEGR